MEHSCVVSSSPFWHFFSLALIYCGCASIVLSLQTFCNDKLTDHVVLLSCSYARHHIMKLKTLIILTLALGALVLFTSESNAQERTEMSKFEQDRPGLLD